MIQSPQKNLDWQEDLTISSLVHAEFLHTTSSKLVGNFSFSNEPDKNQPTQKHNFPVALL